MAVGVEKLKDSGFSGSDAQRSARRRHGAGVSTAPAAFSLLDPAYCAKHGVTPTRCARRMTHVAWKNHDNGARNPKAQFGHAVSTRDDRASAAKVAGRLGVFDCSGVSDGAACALIVRGRGRALDYTDTPMYVKGLSLVAGVGARLNGSRLRLHDLPRGGRRGATMPTRRPGSTIRARSSRWPRCTTASPRPRSCSWRISASPTPATAWKDVLAGDFDAGRAICRSTPTVD